MAPQTTGDVMGAQAGGGADDDPFRPGSLGELAPGLDEPALSPDDALERFLEWCEARGLSLWPHQEDALMELALGNHVVLGTPTGSGKSLVALGMCFMTLAGDGRCYYTAPIKALVSEKFFDLVDVFGKDAVGMVTGDTVINADAPIVCCTAEILANDALREGEDADIARVAMDEFHFFDDRDRGWAWQLPLLALPKTQFMLMSATLGDMGAIAGALEARTGRPVSMVTQAPRPVPLSYEFVDTPLEATVELALKKGDAPLYVVHFSQDAALASAQALASYGVSTKAQRDAIKDELAGTRFPTAFGATLRRLLLAGVGVHHAGMLPRYRLLVERLAQQGLLPVICGTDTLGVGINVPIHTVVLTALAKYDGHHMRRLNAREFHQIAGRAGRAGFDTEGVVIAEATEYDIENARALAKAGGDPKRARSIRKKRPPEGFVGWNRQTFERLVAAEPETLRPRLRMTNAIVLAAIAHGGDARGRVHELVGASLQSDAEKAALDARADEIFDTLIQAGVVTCEEGPDGRQSYSTTVEVPEDFALDQPLSPFLIAALELLDPEDPLYAYDVVSMVEATLEDPRQILRVQERRARDAAMADMKAEGVEYEERMERIQEVTYPQPLRDLLQEAFERYCQEVPWARDFELRPKSVLRDMMETSTDFRGYVSAEGLSRSEGLLLRYLSDAYRVLDRTIPLDKRTEQLEDVVSWLGLMLRSVDSSLLDAWEATGEIEAVAPPAARDEVVHDRRAVRVLVRNALFSRVRLAAHDKTRELGELDGALGWSAAAWAQQLARFHDAHEEVVVDQDARSMAYLAIDESDERSAHVWHVHQAFKDSDDERDFGIWADVDLDATQDEGQAVFSSYRVGFVDDE